jgi:hypothetical protein
MEDLEDLHPFCFEREIVPSGFDTGCKVVFLHLCGRVHPI